MAEIEIFHYRAGTGFFHSLNTGIKYLSGLLLSIALYSSSFLELSIMTAILLPLLFLALKPSLHQIGAGIRSMKGFIIFLLLVASARGFSSGGSIAQRWMSSGLYSWKILMLLIIGQVLISTTDPSDLHGAVYRLLSRIPFIPAGPAATMLSLSITFIPLIFDQYREIRQAADSRLAGLNRNPLKRILFISLPLLETTLSRADEISAAMDSRCYNHNPTLKESAVALKDILVLLSVITATLLIFHLNS
ncbi:MAG: energy-coupling factor transporter transmembrane protein EcfT [Spirochaetales bacterium]|nr:energy-coupling factor transporter transmembrane protein EcfT [Spirochaetales bacterium]